MKKPEMSINKADIAYKMLKGIKITEKEFQLAKKEKFFLNQKALYKDYLISYYEDDKIQGMLCTSGNKVNKRNHFGNKFICAFGVHFEDIKPKYLKPEQRFLYENAKRE